MRKIIFLVIILMAGCFFVSNEAQAAGPTYLTSSNINNHQHWTKENSPYVVDSITVDFDLIIDPGVVVKIKPWAQINFFKKLTAIGTEDEKIIFTSFKDDNFGGDTNRDGDSSQPAAGDWAYLYFNGGKTSEMILENAGVYYGSTKNSVAGSILISRNNNVVVRRTDIKYSGYSGLYIYESQPKLEYLTISNNNVGILVSNPIGMIAKIASSSIVDNNAGALVSGGVYGPGYMRLDARNIWWGDKTGPYYKHVFYGVDNLDGEGNKIGDGVIYDPWLGRDQNVERDPVILIPGIGAPMNLDLMIGGVLNDNWFIVSNTYDGMIEAFDAMGYEQGVDFFICYYDWRNSNASSAKEYLEPLIKKAILSTGSSKVNIVAHSMGGLVARSYIQSEDYDNDVDNLFMIGTPNHGSSDVYPVWEGGYVPNNWPNEKIMKFYLNYLTIKNPTSSKYESVHTYIPSIKQLMPVYDYIHPVDMEDYLVEFELMEEQNDFLLSLNEGIDVLNERVKVSLVAGKDQDTVYKIPVGASDESDEKYLWIDGKPDPIDLVKNDSKGDGRVLMSSALIDSFYTDVYSGSHGEIVSQAQSIISTRLNKTLDRIYDSPIINDEMLIWVASPVDVLIKAPDGKIISALTNEIPLAKFASESRPDGVKLIFIPNPIEGKYEIKLTGNGSGEYHVGLEYADYTGIKKDYSSIVQGTVLENEEIDYVVKYNPNIESPAGDIEPLDNIPPTIYGAATTASNENDWYNHDVIIHFDAYDNESGLDFVTPDIALNNEGANQEATGIAIDKAGNVASSTVKNINIDKTSPFVTEILPFEGKEYLRQDNLEIIFEAGDSLSGIVSTSVFLDGEKMVSTILSLFDYKLGEHILIIEAEDKAGNLSSREVHFFLTASIDSTISDVEKLYNDKEIAKKSINNFLLAQLNATKNEPGGNAFGHRNYQLNILNNIINHLDLALEQEWLSRYAYDIIKEDILYLIQNL